MRILVLDDDEVRHEQFRERLKEHSVVHAWTAEQAGNALEAEKFDLVYLDHDLQDFQHNPSGYGVIEQTGFDVARFIARYLAPQKHPSKVIVHSWNSAGAIRMVKELREAGVPVSYEPFGIDSGKLPVEDEGWVAITVENDMPPEECEKIRRQFQESIASVSNTWRTPIVSDNSLVEFQNLSDSNAKTILNAFKIPPENFPPERPSKCMAESHAAHRSDATTNRAVCHDCQDDGTDIEGE